MYIENLIDRLACNGLYIFDDQLKLSSPDYGIIASMSDQTERGNGYTEKQRTLALNLVSKYQKQLSEALGVNVAELLTAPQFKHPVRTLQYAKSINVIVKGATKIITVQFPYNADMVEAFKGYKTCSPKFIANEIGWNGESRVWEFGFNEPNIAYLANLLDQGFSCDDEFAALAEEVILIESDVEKYVPMVVYENGKFEYKNISPLVPQPNSDNLIEVLLDARRYGITCWDDAINIALKSDEVSKVVRKLLENTVCEPIIAEHATLDDIEQLMHYSANVLFVIPGGSELTHLTKAHAFLNKLCYTNEQLAVMFRLDSSSGKMCNEYIKENHLNNSIGDKIKFVFVSGKIPKPLIESNKKFDIVIHFGTNSAHYTLKNFVKTHHNVVSMTISDQQEINFV